MSVFIPNAHILPAIGGIGRFLTGEGNLDALRLFHRFGSDFRIDFWLNMRGNGLGNIADSLCADIDAYRNAVIANAKP